MANKLRTFSLLMWKNFTVRKRHWKVSLFVEICIPLFLFALTQVIRESLVGYPVPPDENSQLNFSYYPIETKEDLLSVFNHSNTIIYYLRYNDFTEDLMKKTQRCLSFPDQKFIGFDSEDELMNEYASEQENMTGSLVMAVFLKHPNGLNSNLKHLKYTIKAERISSYQKFIEIQLCIDESFIKMKMPSDTSFKSAISIQQMPYFWKSFNLNEIMRTMYASVAVMAFLIPLLVETSYPANEKTLGVNILMSMNGVKNYQNLLSWLISGLFFSTVYIIPRLILFKISFVSSVSYRVSYQVSSVTYGDFWLIAIMHFVHIAHLLAFGFHISSYFSRSIFRSFGIVFFYLGSYGLQTYLAYSNIYTFIPYLGIFFPNILLYRIYEEIDIYENNLLGVRWNNLFRVGDMNYNITGSCGIMLIFSILGIFIHFFLTLYASSLFPGKFGVAKHPLYFLKFLKSKTVLSDEEFYECDYNNMEGKPFEPIPKDVFTPGIQIRNLKKSYITNYISRTKYEALRGISIDFYKGQITTLLGHNGAGKTTMMSILTGLLSSTEGVVLINGKKVTDEMDEIVTDLGLCPQEDILFPDLNVFEQIEFFALLKNKKKSKAQVKKDVIDLMKKLKLTEKQNELPAKLSGGQKRRTCLGIAVVGDASTLILDEPTSGMDPESRREAWDILLNMRGEKTILISTHNMEEADVLGDRTAIIHLGKLRSYGTPMFLKKLYGQGNIEVTLSTVGAYDLEKIKNQLKEKSQLINFDGGKIVLSIPFTDQLPDDLDKIEERKEELGVNGISVSLITLEQVFLQATKNENEKIQISESMEQVKKLVGQKLFFQSTMALFLKKFDYLKKNIFTFFFMVLLPLLGIIFIGITFTDFNGNLSEIPISLDIYRDPQVFYSSNNNSYNKIYKTIVESYNGKAIDVENTKISEAIVEFGQKDLAAYRNNLIAAATFEVNQLQELKANALYSAESFTAHFSQSISFNLLSNTIIKTLIGDEYQIDLSVQNLISKPYLYQFERLYDNTVFNYIRVLLLIVFLFPSVAMYIIHPLRESSSGIKELQRMTGVTGFLYWGTFFLFDFLVFFISMIFILIGLYCMDLAMDLRFFYGTEISIMILLLTLYGLNILPFVYIFSFLKKKTGTVITIVCFLPFLAIGVDSVLRMLLFANLSRENSQLYDTLLSIEKRIFMLMPSISFFYSQVNFFQTAAKNAQCRKLPKYFINSACKAKSECCDLSCLDNNCVKYFEYFGNFNESGNLEESILYLCLTPLLYFAILGLMEHKIMLKWFTKKQQQKPIHNVEEIDDQVKSEKSSVAFEISNLKNQGYTKMQNNPLLNSTKGSDSIYLVYELSKHYGNLTAVKEINFSVKRSECFGLLGVNGAGKSTTFRMLTGEEFPNSGIMYLNGKEITIDRKEYLTQMGYCPQNSALIKSLNTRDHLKLFAFLRGIPKSQVSSEVEKWIDRLNLNLCAAQPSGTYSGGNKRRLSIAIALIGNPNLVLLDEPTTGVDPAARRSLWNVIKSCQLSGQSIILTSHSMEECEALCNRLVIMVKGQLVCIGPSEQLKHRFGAGFDINLKLNPERSNIDVENIKKDMKDVLECELRDEHVGYLTYHVTNSKTKWKTMYAALQHLKEKHSCIEDFSVLSATLEQLFLQFARTNVNNK